MMSFAIKITNLFQYLFRYSFPKLFGCFFKEENFTFKIAFDYICRNFGDFYERIPSAIVAFCPI